jgi:hypothetical protein
MVPNTHCFPSTGTGPINRYAPARPPARPPACWRRCRFSHRHAATPQSHACRIKLRDSVEQLVRVGVSAARSLRLNREAGAPIVCGARAGIASWGRRHDTRATCCRCCTLSKGPTASQRTARRCVPVGMPCRHAPARFCRAFASNGTCEFALGGCLACAVCARRCRWRAAERPPRGGARPMRHAAAGPHSPRAARH